MKLGVVLAGLLGGAFAVGLIAWFGVGGVFASVAAIGWPGFALFVIWQIATFLPLGAGWFILAPGQPLRRFTSFVWGRQVREGAADVLPFSPIGGLVIGVRAVVLCGVDASVAYASVAVDLVAEIIAQLMFMLVGVTLLVGRLSRASLAADPLIFAVFAGLVLMVTATVSFIVVQSRGLSLFDGLIARWLPGAAIQVQDVKAAIAALYRRPLRLSASVLLHLLSWLATSLGSWMALSFMGRPIPFFSVLAVESLVSAMKSAAFMIPNAVGVQEGGFTVVGLMFGLTPDTAIALSLLRRARDIVIGAPTLLVWQAIEGRRLVRSRTAAAASSLQHRS